MRKLISLTLVLIISSQLFSCGFLLYPERRDQLVWETEINWPIVGLDALGFLFYIVPGVIAFAIDIKSNTIYLPSRPPHTIPFNIYDSERIMLNSIKINHEEITKIIKEKRGIEFDFNSPELKVDDYPLDIRKSVI